MYVSAVMDRVRTVLILFLAFEPGGLLCHDNRRCLCELLYLGRVICERFHHTALGLELSHARLGLYEDAAVLCALLLLILVHHGTILHIYLAVYFHAHGIIFALLGHI